MSAPATKPRKSTVEHRGQRVAVAISELAWGTTYDALVYRGDELLGEIARYTGTVDTKGSTRGVVAKRRTATLFAATPRGGRTQYAHRSRADAIRGLLNAADLRSATTDA